MLFEMLNSRKRHDALSLSLSLSLSPRVFAETQKEATTKTCSYRRINVVRDPPVTITLEEEHDSVGNNKILSRAGP